MILFNIGLGLIVVVLQILLAITYADGRRSLAGSALYTVPVSFAIGSGLWNFCLQNIPEHADLALWLYCVCATSIFFILAIAALRNRAEPQPSSWKGHPMTVDFEIARRKLLDAFTTSKDAATTAIATLSCPLTGVVYSVDSIAADFDGSEFCFICADEVIIEAYGQEMSPEYAKSVIVDRILDQARDKRDAVARFDDFVST